MEQTKVFTVLNIFLSGGQNAALLVSLGQFISQNNNEHAHRECNHKEKTHQSLPGKHLLKEQQMRAFHQLRKKEKTLK